MRPLLLLLTLVAGIAALSPAAVAAPTLDDLFAQESQATPEKPQPRDVLKFDPHAIATPEELLLAIYQVDWWVTTSARRFETADARAEILEVHLDLLEAWLAGLDPEVISQEVRDPHFDPAITFTERVFLTWDWQTTASATWRETRDLALDDLRLKRPLRALNRYREFRTTHEVAATPDQVLLFLRQLGAARIAAGGPSWRAECLRQYHEQASLLLSKFPQFAGMTRYGGRKSILETLYEDPSVRPQVWRIRTLLDLLTASGPAGYESLLDYRAQYADAFLPYPEKVALDGGGLGLPLLEAVLAEPELTVQQRQSLLAVALDHARQDAVSSLTLPTELLNGHACLYAYTPEQKTFLEEQFRALLVTPSESLVIDPIFQPRGGAPRLPASLRTAASLVLELEDPLAEVRRLLDSGEAQAQAVGLSVLILGLEDSGSFTYDEWLGTEATYLQLASGFFDSPVPEIRDLAWLLLVKCAVSPAPLEGDRLIHTLERVPALSAMQAEASPDRAAIPRILALSMHRRGVPIRELWSLIDGVDAYAETLDPATLGLDAALELLDFVRAVADPAVQPPNGPAFLFPILEPEQKRAVIAAALDRMTLFHRMQSLEPLIDDLEYLRAAGYPPDDPVRTQLQKLSASRESLMIHPDVAVRIDALLAVE